MYFSLLWVVKFFSTTSPSFTLQREQQPAGFGSRAAPNTFLKFWVRSDKQQLSAESQSKNSLQSIWIPELTSRGRMWGHRGHRRKVWKIWILHSIGSLSEKRIPDRYRLKRYNQRWEFCAHPLWQTPLWDLFSRSYFEFDTRLFFILLLNRSQVELKIFYKTL